MSKKASPDIIRSGKVEFHRLNAARYDLRDAYRWLLTLEWRAFFAFVLVVYLAVNLFFATLYYLGNGCIAEMAPHSFDDAFFFSVETLATVGYGHMYPATLYGHMVTTLEIMVGMFGLAVITGLIFVRFSRPAARIIFSRSLVIGPFDGQQALMMRVANLRRQAMAEAEFRMILICDEPVKEGGSFRRFYPLRLQFDRLIMFPAALTVRHMIDRESPLHGMTAKDLEKSDARISASIVCIDTIIPASVQSQTDYTWRDIEFGRRFVEIYSDIDTNSIAVDYGRLHETEPVA